MLKLMGWKPWECHDPTAIAVPSVWRAIPGISDWMLSVIQNRYFNNRFNGVIASMTQAQEESIFLRRTAQFGTSTIGNFMCVVCAGTADGC